MWLISGTGKRKKSWTRAVFSHLQRKGLEKRFQMQKYITKPDRRQLAASLGLTDAQVPNPLINGNSTSITIHNNTKKNEILNRAESVALKNNVLRSVAKKHFLKTLALAIAKFILSHFADKICKVLSGLHS